MITDHQTAHAAGGKVAGTAAAGRRGAGMRAADVGEDGASTAATAMTAAATTAGMWAPLVAGMTGGSPAAMNGAMTWSGAMWRDLSATAACMMTWTAGPLSHHPRWRCRRPQPALRLMTQPARRCLGLTLRRATRSTRRSTRSTRKRRRRTSTATTSAKMRRPRKVLRARTRRVRV